MKLTILFLDVLLVLLGASESYSSIHDGEKPPSLVHLFRSKRFDFTMFGCSDCRPVMECHTDSYCKYKKGSQYTCEFRCCSFRCVIRNSESHRAASASHFYPNDEADDDVTENESGENQQNEDLTKNETDIKPLQSQPESTFASVILHTSTEATNRTQNEGSTEDEDG